MVGQMTGIANWIFIGWGIGVIYGLDAIVGKLEQIRKAIIDKDSN
jgi:hypothetical protein